MSVATPFLGLVQLVLQNFLLVVLLIEVANPRRGAVHVQLLPRLTTLDISVLRLSIKTLVVTVTGNVANFPFRCVLHIQI